MSETIQLKHCPICSKDLLVSEFGICRARKDGRNLYDKACIRTKVNEQRRLVREMKAARQKYQLKEIEFDELLFAEESAGIQSPTPFLIKKSPVERVREAIQNGARTQKQIAQETKISKDEIGDAIANLLLWTKEIKTKVVDDTRMYFLNTVEVEQKLKVKHDPVPFFDIASKLGAPSVKGEKRIKKVA